jgi:cell division protein FtsB
MEALVVDPGAARRPRARGSHLLWALLVGALSAYSLVTIWTNVLPTRRTLAATERRLQRLDRENAAHERFLAAAARECDLLRSDPFTVERALRDTLNMRRAGEHVYR